MGTRTQRIVFDDLDHSAEAVGTYRFALEGVEYEIDLSEPHLGELRTVLRPYIAAGRRLRRTVQCRSVQRRPVASPSRPGLRDWWAANAEQLGLPEHRTRGKVPDVVNTAYDSHH